MRRCLAIPTVLLLALATATPVSAQAGFDAEIARARAVLEPIISLFPGLAVSVTVDGEEVWADGWGFADTKTGQRAAPDTRFNVYSVAKMLTGIAAARLDEMGLLDLDEPLTNIIEQLPDSYGNVTPRLLIGHLAGVSHYASDEDWQAFGTRHCTEPADALPHFTNRPLMSAPGAERTYSTYGYVLLSEVLARRSPQKSYTQFMRQEIFDVAGMRRTRLDAEGLGPEAKATTVHWARHSGGSPGGRAFLVVLLTHRVSVGIAANADGPSLRSAASNIAYVFAGVDP